MPSIRGLVRRFRGPPLDRVALLGESAEDYSRFWDQSARVDAKRAIAHTQPDFWASGETDAAALQRYISKDDTVLEIGCGMGRVMAHLAPWCKELHGVDISKEMIGLAREALSHLPNVRLRAGNGYDLPFQRATFDVVYSCRVFQHIPKNIVVYLLRETYRVLRPSGRFILQVPNIHLEEHMDELDYFARPHFFKKPYPMFYYTPDEVVRIGSYVGFDVEIVDEWLTAVLTRPESASP